MGTWAHPFYGCAALADQDYPDVLAVLTHPEQLPEGLDVDYEKDVQYYD